ncbi:hypothetical protein AwPolaro_11410 [Polaromonas sp.]|nr:hypothetical protein AwPolaro_11410 [Polaromonas sp.]
MPVKRKGFLAKGHKEETLSQVEAIACSVMSGTLPNDEESQEL